MNILSNSENTLLDMGVPDHVLDTSHPAPYMQEKLHHPKRHCSVFSVETSFGKGALMQQTTLRKISSAKICHCLSAKGLNEDDPWHYAGMLLEAHEKAREPLEGLAVKALVEHYWQLGKLTTKLHKSEIIRRTFHYLSLPDAIAHVTQKLLDAQRAVVGRLQEDTIRAQFNPHNTISTRSLLLSVSVPGGLPYKAREWDLDALLFSYAQRRGNALLLELPDNHAGRILEWIETYRETRPDIFADVHELTAEDTPAVLEVAKALWDTSSASMYLLENAILAARELCKAPA